jgi:acyl-CoA thioesterase FadM
MYPVVRLIKGNLLARFQPPLALFETHVSQHICWPWDIDPWMELNNGRALTLFDLGRMPFSARLGMIAVLRANGWGMAAAGNSVRYRRRVRPFHRVEMRTRMLGWDRRFLYVEQAMWRRGEALNHMLIRIATTSPSGIVPPADLIGQMGADPASPPLPDWVTAWIEADLRRPWPPVDAAAQPAKSLISNSDK